MITLVLYRRAGASLPISSRKLRKLASNVAAMHVAGFRCDAATPVSGAILLPARWPAGRSRSDWTSSFNHASWRLLEEAMLRIDPIRSRS